MMRWLLVAACLLLPPAVFADEALPRTIVALYDSKEDATPRTGRVHRMLEMPLNHLGFTIQYADVQKPLPVLGKDVRGLLIWFREPTELADPDGLLDWANKAVDSGKRLVVFGHMGFNGKFRDSPEGMRKINTLLNKIGVNQSNYRVTLTYEAKIVSADPSMMGYERTLDILFPPFFAATRSSKDAASYFRLRHVAGKEEVSDLVITSPRGGYVADDYGVYKDQRSEAQQWYINPFLFFDKAFGFPDAPKPDVTTLDGRRIFYSQIDGDGWNNVTELEKYKQDKLIAAQVITREVLQQYPELAFTMGLITSELDPDCYGYPQSVPAAVEMLRLPNVEPASHSYSHPLYWNYFADGLSAKEKTLLPMYPPRPPRQGGLFSALNQPKDPWADISAANLPASALLDRDTGENMNDVLKRYFGVPRSYACAPFDIDREIAGSIAFINVLSPKEKPVRLFQWSGDTSPFPEALRKTMRAKVENINGGDTRYDAEYPSYSWVSPIGLRVADNWQVFSSNSNENTYTHLWTNRFFGFRYLQTTVYNTDTPVRIKPFNVYFHVFSGEKQASLNAIKENLNFARNQEIIPVPASRYAAIARGYFTARIVPSGDQTWNIADRGALTTVRFDHATLKQVDFSRSQGVIGQRHYQGSLYVALDDTVAEPVVALKLLNHPSGPPNGDRPYLIESRWDISGVKTGKEQLEFTAQGYGNGDMRWYVPFPGPYEVTVTQDQKILYKAVNSANAHPVLSLGLKMDAIRPVHIHLKKSL